jgi:hypothetical protein
LAQTWCVIQYNISPWFIVFLCLVLSIKLFMAMCEIVELLDAYWFVIYSMMVLCIDVWVHAYVGGMQKIITTTCELDEGRREWQIMCLSL